MQKLLEAKIFILTILPAALLILLSPFSPARAAISPRVTPVVLAVKKVSPTVVNISCEKQASFSSTSNRSPFGSSLFDDFFRDFFSPHLEQRDRSLTIGSGVILNSDGYVLTNNHVTAEATKISVKLIDGRTLPAELVGAAPDIDLALIKISKGGPFPASKLGSSKSLMIGETVIAIGNPFGLSHSISRGVISALHRSFNANQQTYHNFIQTDAAINPGNSGGPLINILGEVIGINTAILSQSGGSLGIGFAIPIDTAKRIMDDLLNYGELQPIWFGTFVQDLQPKLADYFKLEDSSGGVLVRQLESNSPAARAGIKVGDIILKVEDLEILDSDSLRSLLGKYTPGDSLKVELLRQGKLIVKKLVASKFPAGYADKFIKNKLGFSVSERGGKMLDRLRGDEQQRLVFSQVINNGAAAQIGIRQGDILLKYGNKKVSNKQQLRKEVLKNIYRKDVVILVQRGRYGYYITLSYAP